ncbi:MAG: endonuclease/exonuclease/phosphatase family protein [Myxococcota bacterium]
MTRRHILFGVFLGLIAFPIALMVEVPQRILSLWAPGTFPIKPDVVVEGEALSVTVVTWNVLCSFCAKDGYDDWSARLPRIQRALHEMDADLIAAQELFTDDQVAAIAGKTYGVVRPLPGYADSTIFYRKGRLKPRATGAIWMSPSPQRPMSWGWHPWTFPRLAAWAVMDTDAGPPLLVVSTHLDSDPKNHRPSRQILQQVVAPLAETMPVIIAGDFNQSVDEADLTPLIEAASIAQEADFVGQLDGAAHTRRELLPAHRIDQIWLGGPGRITVARWTHHAPVDGSPSTRPSDHPAIYTEATFYPSD